MCRKNSYMIHVLFSPSLWQWALLCLPGSLELDCSWAAPQCESPQVIIFAGNYFWTTLKCHYSSTIRAFDLIPKLRARPEYQQSSGTNYINLIQCDLHRHYLDVDTTQSILNNSSGQQSNAIKYKFMTWIWLLFCLQMSSHMSLTVLSWNFPFNICLMCF